MIIHVVNFIFEGDKIVVESNNEPIKISNKFLDYFLTLRELAKSGIIVTFKSFDIQDYGIRCLDNDTNDRIISKYNELFPSHMNKREVLEKCKSILKNEGII